MYCVYITEKDGTYEVNSGEHNEGAIYCENFENAFSAKRRMKMLKTCSQQVLRDIVQTKTQKQFKTKRDFLTSNTSKLSPLEELDRILKNN